MVTKNSLLQVLNKEDVIFKVVGRMSFEIN